MKILQLLLGEFNRKLIRLKDLVEREISFPNAPGKIKVAIGMRRSGKTYFLYQHILKLMQANVSQKAILYLNLEDDRLLPVDDKKLAKFIDAFYALYPENHERKCYLFLDEIQNVVNWPAIVRRLQDTKNVEIFLAGSSAKLLSKEIASSLRGRSLATEIWPYSFNEFLKAKKVTIERELYDQQTQDLLKSLFHNYLSEGGFPEIILYEPDIKQQTLQEYLNVTIFRDLVERHQIKNPTLIKYMILSMLHNISRSFAINKFYNDVKTQGYKIGKDLLYEYTSYIEDAYLAFLISNYDRSLRKTYTNPKKIYGIDPGLIRALTLDYKNDLGRLFENIVYLDLNRLGCNIHYYLTEEQTEVDFFVQTSQGHQKLFQVVWDIENIETLQRETSALQKAKQELKIEGEIVTLDSYLQKGLNLS